MRAFKFRTTQLFLKDVYSLTDTLFVSLLFYSRDGHILVKWFDSLYDLEYLAPTALAMTYRQLKLLGK